MSFSGKIKEELAQHYAKARHCNLAELSALVHMSGSFEKDGYGSCILKMMELQENALHYWEKHLI